ncbi:MAG TPA: FAD-dependent monooxygenase [Methylovirgula sp.]
MTTTAADADILVIGTGAAGLSAAIALADAGFTVAAVGSLEQFGNGRTVALFEASLRFYDALNIWPRLTKSAAGIETIRMVDATQARLPIPPIEFRAEEIGLSAFGENVENDALVRCLADVAAEKQSLSIANERLVDLIDDDNAIEAVFQSGHRIRAKLIVAADGQRSTVRAKAKIGARRWSYPQTAMTALTAHEMPHNGLSVEFHTRSGPCTLVPLSASADAPNRSSLVWLMRPEDAARRHKLSQEDFAGELERQVGAIFGPMRLDGALGSFPMTGLRVSRLTARRIALLGEAAHVFPPLAAQGLNLSLRDTAALVECVSRAKQSGEDIGAPSVLAAYADARRADISLRTHGIDILNRSLLADFVPVDLVRGASFVAFNMIGPLRRAIMREGILPRGHLPPLMQRPRAIHKAERKRLG